MAVTSMFNFIGAKIYASNSWVDGYAVNAIQLPNQANGDKGQVVNFVGQEKEYLGIDDSKGSAFYIRINPEFNYIEKRQLTSCSAEFEKTIDFKFVFFAINQKESYDPLKLENNFSNDLINIGFSEYTGNERKIKLSLKKSNSDAFAVFTEEIGKKYEFGAESVFISIDGNLKFLSTQDCVSCD